MVIVAGRRKNEMNHRKRLSLSRMVIGDARGVTYLLAMMAIVLIGISVTVAAKQWKTMMQRENEADLLAHGIEIQMAIAAYSETKKKGRPQAEVYPLTLDELTKVTMDEMTRRPKRFLRKVYRDPITRSDWDYIPGPPPNGGIMGIRSKSQLTALKQHEFPAQLRHFEGLTHYNEWVFQHPNASSAQGQAPLTGPQTQPGTSPSTTPPAVTPVIPGIGSPGVPGSPGGSPGVPPGAPGFPPPPLPPPTSP